jgi:hypothetical protein
MGMYFSGQIPRRLTWLLRPRYRSYATEPKLLNICRTKTRGNRYIFRVKTSWANMVVTASLEDLREPPKPLNIAVLKHTGCRHRRKISSYVFLFIFLDTDPHLASVVCVPLSLFRFEIRVVCVWELVYVCAYEHKFGVATNHGKF